MLAKRTLVPSPEWAGILLVVSAVLLVAAPRSAAAAEAWLVREQSGTLQYRLPETSEWSPAAPGSELHPGTTVHAGGGRPAILTQAARSIVIRAGSELTLPPTGTATFVQWLGSVRYEVEPGPLPGFFVDTRYLVIGIKGTIFEILASEAGTEVRVSEGLVEVAGPDGRSRAVVAPGQIAWVGSAPGSLLEVRSESSGTNATFDPIGGLRPGNALRRRVAPDRGRGRWRSQPSHVGSKFALVRNWRAALGRRHRPRRPPDNTPTGNPGAHAKRRLGHRRRRLGHVGGALGKR